MDGYHDPAARLRQQAIRTNAAGGRFDPWILGSSICLLSLGIVMVASSSMGVAEKEGVALLSFFYRHIFYVLLGIGVALFVMHKVEIRALTDWAKWLPPIGMVLLLLVLVPGLGHEVNGALRWIRLPVAGTFQPSEAAKLILIIWLGSYLARFSEEVKGSWVAVFKSFGIAFAFSGILLLVQKDFGSTALVLAITAGMIVLGGLPTSRIVVAALLLVPLGILMIIIEPYRIRRLTTFRNPWQDPYGDGYQLSNALIAIGRGDFSGVGLGGSVQKLNYLPEGHTDFIMSVLAEELGFVGVCTIIILYAVIVGRALWIGQQCVNKRRHFSGYLVFGIALWLALQSMISIGVNLGALPTKGLTLPLISFGGSSTLMFCLALGLLLRVSWELERSQQQAATLRHEVLNPGKAAVDESLGAASPAASPIEPRRMPDIGNWLQQQLARIRSRPERGARTPSRERIDPSFGEATR